MSRSSSTTASGCCHSIVMLCIWTLIFPPIAVFLLGDGCCTFVFWLNCFLTFIGMIPGQIHAFCLIYKEEKKRSKRRRNN